jgi:hypothetical protein
MSFTYDLSSSDEQRLNIAQVRLELGDTTFNAGVKPDGTNFSDEELASWLTAEGDHVMRSVARACGALARMWSNKASESVGALRVDYGKIAGDWAKRASELGTDYGVTGSGFGFGVASARVDGYSENAAATDL